MLQYLFGKKLILKRNFSIFSVFLSLSIVTSSSLVRADKPERSTRLNTEKHQQVNPGHSELPVPAKANLNTQFITQYSELVSYEVLMMMPERDRLTYLQKVRSMLVEIELATQKGSVPNKQNASILKEVDFFISLFLNQAQAAPKRYTDNSGKIWECPESAKLMHFTDGVYCRENGKSVKAARVGDRPPAVPATVPPPVPPPAPPQPPPASPAEVIGPKPVVAVPPGPPEIRRTAPPPTAAAPQPPPAPAPGFNPNDYDPNKSAVAKADNFKGGGYDQWAKKVQGSGPVCGFVPMDKATCEKQKKTRDTQGGCFIAGVASKYNKGGWCQPVTKLCYSKKGIQKINEECASLADKAVTFECGRGQTVCSIEIGRRLEEHKDKTNGAFCVPDAGKGAMSASTMCLEFAEKYAKSIGDRSVNDILATARGDSEYASNRWNELKRQLKDICGGYEDKPNDRTIKNLTGDEVTTRVNCEACQIMKYRLAQMRQEISKKIGKAGAECSTDEEALSFLKTCIDDPAKCGGTYQQRKIIH